MHLKQRVPVVAEAPGLRLRRETSQSQSSLNIGTDPVVSGDVAPALLAYLADRWRTKQLHFGLRPRLIPDGWESHTYEFRLRGLGLAEELSRTMIAHLFSTVNGLPLLQRAFAAQKFLHQHGYPVPRPVLIEENGDVLGGPFLILERAPGRTLLQVLLRDPLQMWGLPGAMGRLHARLHRLPAADFPSAPGPFLTRRLHEIADLIHAHDLRGLMRGLDWLRIQQPAPPAALSILHLDYHPVNLIRLRKSKLVVVDWTDADTGDYHADVASTLMLLECMPVPQTRFWARVAAPLGRVLLRRWYLDAYRNVSKLDEEKLAYYRAWAALRRLVLYVHWLRTGPADAGCTSAALRYLTPDLLARLQRYFSRWSGVELRL